MNKWIYLAGGILIGGVAGFFGGVKLTEKKATDAENKRADEEIEAMRRYYERKSNYDGCCHTRGSDKSEKNVSDERNSEPAEGETPRSDGLASVCSDGDESGGRRHKTDYAAYYKAGSAKTDLTHKEGVDPEAAEEETEEPNEIEQAVEEVKEQEAERESNKHLPPRIISAEAVDELPPYVTLQVLYYYPETDVMTDEDDHMVGEAGEYGYLVGDCLDQYGFKEEDNTERVIFVRNFELDACYEIQKMPGDDPITAAAINDTSLV